MKRSMFTLFLTWIFTIQAVFAFSPQANEHKSVDQIIANYNAFAASPTNASLPSSNFSAADTKVIKEYLSKNKINGPLPQVKLMKSGEYEMTTQGQSIILEINPTAGIIRINSGTLILKSGGGFKGRLEQIEKFLTSPKSANNTVNRTVIKTIEALLSFIVSNANADCLSKYDAAIKAKMNTAKGAELSKDVFEWSFGITIFASLLLSGGIATVAAYTSMVSGGTGMIMTVASDNNLADLAYIRGALTVAKEGKVPVIPSNKEQPYSQDEVRFLQIHEDQFRIVKNQGGIPLSEEAFLKVLAEGNKDESLCTPVVQDHVVEFLKKITSQKSLDPNEVNKQVKPVTSIVEETRKNIVKEVTPDEIEHKDIEGAVSQ